MLYLPLGVKNYLEEIAIRKTTNLGSFLIEIVCKSAWEMGYRCKHPDAFRQVNKKSGLWKCKVCGMSFGKMKGDKLGGYPLVSYLGPEK